jgi:hypothetical protein
MALPAPSPFEAYSLGGRESIVAKQSVQEVVEDGFILLQEDRTVSRVRLWASQPQDGRITHAIKRFFPNTKATGGLLRLGEYRTSQDAADAYEQAATHSRVIEGLPLVMYS